MADAVEIADSVLGVVGEVALEAGEVALFAALPWLNIPVVRQVVQLIAGWLAGQVLLQLKAGSNVLIITFENAAESSAAKGAAQVLQVVQADPNATGEERQNAVNDFKKKYADLIRQRVATPK